MPVPKPKTQSDWQAPKREGRQSAALVESRAEGQVAIPGWVDHQMFTERRHTRFADPKAPAWPIRIG
jgi:hypothetical protein